MQIKIEFDPNNDNLDDLKKLCAVLQEIIYRREKKLPINEVELATAKYKESKKPAKPVQTKLPDPKKETKTSGGCRYVPYEDLSDTMADIFSRKKH